MKSVITENTLPIKPIVQSNRSSAFVPKSLVLDISPFLFGSILVFFTVYYAVPYLSEKIGIMQIGAWMLLSVPFVFMPLIATGFGILRTEQGSEKVLDRLRFRKLTKSDIKWTLIGLAGMIVGGGLCFYLSILLKINTNPPFAQNVTAWTDGHLWMFSVWIIYWIFNIMGEGIVWRGIIQPRLEAKYGNCAWLLAALLWGIFHWSFGLGNVIVLLPTLVFVPYITYKTQNTWTGIILHALLSGPGFIVLAFGLMK